MCELLTGILPFKNNYLISSPVQKTNMIQNIMIFIANRKQEFFFAYSKDVIQSTLVYLSFPKAIFKHKVVFK